MQDRQDDSRAAEPEGPVTQGAEKPSRNAGPDQATVRASFAQGRSKEAVRERLRSHRPAAPSGAPKLREAEEEGPQSG